MEVHFGKIDAMSAYILEHGGHVVVVGLDLARLGLHLRVRVNDDGDEHVDEHEEAEEDVDDEVKRSQEAVGLFQLSKVEVAQNHAEQRQAEQANK
jgi:hypothetical protein